MNYSNLKVVFFFPPRKKNSYSYHNSHLPRNNNSTSYLPMKRIKFMPPPNPILKMKSWQCFEKNTTALIIRTSTQHWFLCSFLLKWKVISAKRRGYVIRGQFGQNRQWSSSHLNDSHVHARQMQNWGSIFFKQSPCFAVKKEKLQIFLHKCTRRTENPTIFSCVEQR